MGIMGIKGLNPLLKFVRPLNVTIFKTCILISHEHWSNLSYKA